MKKKIITMLGVCILTLGAVTGCGGDAGNSTDPQPPVVESIQPEDGTSEEASESGDEGGAVEADTEAGAGSEVAEDSESGAETDEASGSETEAASESAADVPDEVETGDGVYSGYLRASDRNLIGTTNEYGIFYAIVYQAEASDGKIIISGSMDYRNDPAQDPMTVSDDLRHIFTMSDDITYEMRGGEDGAEVVSAEEFAGYLQSLSDSGLYLQVEVLDGKVVTASISA